MHPDGEAEACCGEGRDVMKFEVGSEDNGGVDGGVNDAAEFSDAVRRDIPAHKVAEVLEAPEGKFLETLTP